MGDDLSYLKEWVAVTQGISPEEGSEDGILRAVLRQDAKTREAAMALPFETEPASYTRNLEKIADKVTPK